MADTAKDASQASTEEQKPASPPWGDDFDAERAWTLVQNLRTEKEDLKGEVATLKQKSQELEAGESDGLKELRTRAEAAETRAAKAEHELTLAKVLRDFPALEGFEDLLTGDDEEAVRAKAERLAAIGGGKKPEGDPAPGQEEQKLGEEQEEQKQEQSGLPAKPEPDLSLTPGHGGDDKVPFDPAAIAQAARAASTF
ncbi:hypothetical protein [Arthrobacter sp. B2a2-09]|uniref:hypothetical protein n=1 Tax=Arthrobacter sp. B2a2-09 TaxID=2952822 RepID=UPI0022CD98CC|nr:hypothetical protein [Arthrobacter sp. B2a2-09]MCZ9884647.1 hypothetical protein [Arthrobacter sp. B2a2-09]